MPLPLSGLKRRRAGGDGRRFLFDYRCKVKIIIDALKVKLQG